MLPEFGLINMNGRMYDPLLGRFLSPDNYVQLPDLSQSFNRYSYCLNNPLKYTDPSGEVWWVPIVVGATLFAVGNTAANVIRQNGSWHDWIKYTIQGAFVGASLGAAWQFSPLIPWAGETLHSIMSVYGISQGCVGLLSMALSAAIKGKSGFENSGKLFLGNFYLDENTTWKDFYKGVWQGFSRHTWESLQSFGGSFYSQANVLLGNTQRVDYLGGVSFSTIHVKKAEDEKGVSLGNYTTVWNSE